MSLKVALILFIKVVLKRFNFAVGRGIVRFFGRFKLVLFICSMNVRIKPNFFSSFGRKKVALGVLTYNVIFLNILATIVLRCTANVPVPAVIKVLSNTMAGAPKLKTTRRTFSSVRKISSGAVTLKCTITCPLKIVNVVLSVVLVGCVFHMDFSGRGRRLGDRSSSRAGRTGPVSLVIGGPTVFGGAITRLSGLLRRHSFIVSHI